jgi:2-methylcitrate dehydratase PrpD
MPRTIAEKLGHWAAGLRLGDVPGEVTSIATRCLIDVVGVSLAGAETASARRVRRLVSRQYGQGPCTILGDTTARVAGLGAALANGVAAHALDFDDNSYAGIVHGSASVSPRSPRR